MLQRVLLDILSTKGLLLLKSLDWRYNLLTVTFVMGFVITFKIKYLCLLNIYVSINVYQYIINIYQTLVYTHSVILAIPAI